MKIAPIMAYRSQNLQSKTQKQNVSFGKFENEETKQYVKDNILKFDRYEEPAKEVFEYFDETPFLTIKRKNNITYAVYEKPAIDKHENKELFENTILANYRNLDFWFLPERREKALPQLEATESNIENTRINRVALGAGIIKEEPCYLTTIEKFGPAYHLFKNFIDAEMGRDPYSSNSTASIDLTPTDNKPDNWDKVHDWGLY